MLQTLTKYSTGIYEVQLPTNTHETQAKYNTQTDRSIDYEHKTHQT